MLHRTKETENSVSSRLNLPSSGPAALTFDTAPGSARPVVRCLDTAAASIATTYGKRSATGTSCMDMDLEDVAFLAPHRPSVTSTTVQVDEAFLCS